MGQPFLDDPISAVVHLRLTFSHRRHAMTQRLTSYFSRYKYENKHKYNIVLNHINVSRGSAALVDFDRNMSKVS